MENFTLGGVEPEGEEDEGGDDPEKDGIEIGMDFVCQINEKQKNTYHSTHDGRKEVKGGTVGLSDMLHDDVLATTHGTPGNGFVTFLMISLLNGLSPLVVLFLDEHNGAWNVSAYNRLIGTLVITAASNPLLQQPCL